ncbi:MAG: hypothetical protein AAF573_01885, partial [Bacteroidota bacterium]
TRDMKKLNFYLFVIALLFFAGCDTEDETIPAYIHVKSFNLQTNPGQGTSTAPQIKDVWVTLEQEGFLGNYELPATLPLVAEGPTKMFLDAGIKVNGITNTPDIYPFYARYELTPDLVLGEIDTLQPVAVYDSRVQFPYLENFDGGNTLDVTFDNAPNILGITNEPAEVFEGNSAKFTLDTTTTRFEIATSDSRRMELPKEGRSVFLEMHYKNEGLLEVGLVGYRSSDNFPNRTYFFALNPKEEWNKIYIDLTDQLINAAPDIVEFQILFGAQLPAGVTSASYFIDNIKVLHFQD